MGIRNFFQLLFGIFTFIPGIYYLRKMNTGSGGTFSSNYCYAVWFRHLSKIYLKTRKFKFRVVAEIGPGDSFGLGILALILGAKKYYAYDSVKFINTDRNLKIFYELVQMLKSKKRIPDENIFPRVNPTLNKYNFPLNIYSKRYLKNCLNKRRLLKIKNSIIRPESKNSLIVYKNSWKDFNNLKIQNTVDLIISQATLEHIDDLNDVYKKMRSWIKSDGIMSHSIDFKSHGYTANWDGHWELSSFYWKLLRGRRPYLINRAPYSYHIDILKKNNFSLIYNENILHNSNVVKINAPYNFTKADLNISCSYVMATTMRGSKR